MFELTKNNNGFELPPYQWSPFIQAPRSIRTNP